jgi:hypothetical protein
MWDQFSTLLAESTSRIVAGFANFLPGLVALLLIVLVTIVIASLLRMALQYALRRIKFDEQLARWGFPEVADWTPERSPAALVLRVFTWLILGAGFLAGISALDSTLPSLLVVRLLDYIPKLVVAFLILLVGTIASRFLARNVLIGAVNMKLHSARAMSLFVKWLVLVLSAAMALQHLEIGGNIVPMAFGILFGGIVLAVSLAVGLGSREAVRQTWERNRSHEDSERPVHHL